MDIIEAIKRRHSVRSFTKRPINDESITILKKCIADCNAKGKLHLQLVTDEPRAFDCFLAHYGKFSGVRNYIAMVGHRGKGLDERIGYYGERLVLLAQTLGLNTCWVGLSFTKAPGAWTVGDGEKLVCLIAIGYGNTQGADHRSKSIDDVTVVKADGDTPKWFTAGVEAALLAPTAMNQQKFKFTLHPDGRTVTAKAGLGFFSKVDLGIAKYHFEAGAGVSNFNWSDSSAI